MPRGKNYVNNNRGVTMQSSTKKKAPSMEQCFYGAGCTRENCFYRHDGPGKNANGENAKSAEPCMPFLAGLCTFTTGGCRKRHPGKAEAERLIAKYQQTKCRYGDQCKTDGCLYIHPNDDTKNGGLGADTVAFPPLAGASPAAARPVVPPLSGAWKPMQPTGAFVPLSAPAKKKTAAAAPAPKAAAPASSAGGPPSSQPAAAAKAAAVPGSAWNPQPVPGQPTNSVWGQPRNPALLNSATATAKTTKTAPVPAVSSSSEKPKPPSKKKQQQPPQAQPPMSFAAAAAAGAAKSQPPPPPKPTPSPKKPTPAAPPKAQQPPKQAAAAPAPAPAPVQQPRPQVQAQAQEETPEQRAASDASLNIHAKEFVPGMGFSY